MINSPSMMFIFAANQHQRRRDKKFNLCWFVNLFNRKGYVDYCMEAWVALYLRDNSWREYSRYSR